jgi:hypothetical protein
MDNHEPETGLSFERVVFFSDRVLDPTTKRKLSTDDAAIESA